MNGFEIAKTIAETFEAVCVGVAALLGGVGALKILSEWSEVRRAKRQRNKWKKLFPKAALGKDFILQRLSYTKESGGTVIGSSDNVYICDNRSGTKHWVANEYTLHTLEFNQEEVAGVKQKELDKFKAGEKIDLSALQKS